MFGKKKIPFQIEKNGTKLQIVSHGEKKFLYQREMNETKIQKTLLTNAEEVLICPIEPVMLPKEISNHLLIELEDPIFLQANLKQKVYLQFPIEIGVFLKHDADPELIDVFSYITPEYSLYGDPRSGVICRYCKSSVYYEKPVTEFLKYGIISVLLENNHSHFVQINQILFNAFGMKIFYDERTIEMKAKMKITDKTMAETDFISRISGLKKSQEIITQKKLSISSTKALMLEGI